MRLGFWILAVVAWTVAFDFMVGLGVSGSLWIGIVPIIISPVGMLLVRVFYEGGQPTGLFDPRTQSWAFLFGDFIALPVASIGAALGWHHFEKSGMWYGSLTWFLVSFIAGLAVALAWHFVKERPAYKSRGAADRLDSPTKLWHDFTVYASLSGGLIYLGAPLLIYRFFENDMLIAVAGGVFWGACGAYDALVQKPRPENMHPRTQDTLLAR